MNGIVTSDRYVEACIDAGLLKAEEAEPVLRVAPRFDEADPHRLLGLALAAAAPSLGHAGALVGHEQRLLASRLPTADDGVHAPARSPLLENAVDAATSSGLVGRSTSDGHPFVIASSPDGPLLMMQRMAREEERLAEALSRLASLRPAPPEGLDATLVRLFGDASDGEQATAVRLAASRALTVVTGGPGTGKTFTVKRLLAALLVENEALAVRIAAPTGKAAARMAEALNEGDPLDVPPTVAERLRTMQGETLHRLIGLGASGVPWHGPGRPVAADVVVVDEASMVDLPLMRRTVEALPPSARLVLLGDPDQLPSVDMGRVLADVVASPALAPNRAALTRSFRFGHAPDIALAAACLMSTPVGSDEVPADAAGREALAVALLRGERHAANESDTLRVTRLHVKEDWNGRPTKAQLDALAEGYRTSFLPALANLGATPDAAGLRRLLDAFDGYRVLTLHRDWPCGVEAVDEALARRLGLGAGLHVHGRPVIITQNAYDVGLFNGDTGIVVRRSAGFEAVFPEGRTGIRAVPVDRLPAHEGALALTVHKSQGSQFGHVALVMAGRPSPLATREVVYTALTRAKDRFSWLGTGNELERALGNRLVRWSGLGPRLTSVD
jgi:exodeoxyribonuclease V alpha subunit